MKTYKLTESEFKKIWGEVLEGIGNDLVNELVKIAPVDTGFLRNSIRYEVKGNVINIYMADYWVYVEFGTLPHIIKPKNKKSLHWEKNGEDFFSKIVYHPGNHPNPFIRTTLNTKLKSIIKNNIVMRLENVSR